MVAITHSDILARELDAPRFPRICFAFSSNSREKVNKRASGRISPHCPEEHFFFFFYEERVAESSRERKESRNRVNTFAARLTSGCHSEISSRISDKSARRVVSKIIA